MILRELFPNHYRNTCVMFMYPVVYSVPIMGASTIGYTNTPSIEFGGLIFSLIFPIHL